MTVSDLEKRASGGRRRTATGLAAAAVLALAGYVALRFVIPTAGEPTAAARRPHAAAPSATGKRTKAVTSRDEAPSGASAPERAEATPPPAEPPRRSWIEGRVVDEDGAAVEGARIVLLGGGADPPNETESGADGRFLLEPRFEGPPPDEAALLVTCAGFRSATRPFPASVTGPILVGDVALERLPEGATVLVLRDRSGRPIAGTRVVLLSVAAELSRVRPPLPGLPDLLRPMFAAAGWLDRSGEPLEARTTADPSGLAVFDGESAPWPAQGDVAAVVALPPGDCEGDAWSSFATKSGPGRREVALDVRRAVLAGRVADADGRPVAGARVRLLHAPRAARADRDAGPTGVFLGEVASAGTDGRFSLCAAASEEVCLEVLPPGGLPSYHGPFRPGDAEVTLRLPRPVRHRIRFVAGAGDEPARPPAVRVVAEVPTPFGKARAEIGVEHGVRLARLEDGTYALDVAPGPLWRNRERPALLVEVREGSGSRARALDVPIEEPLAPSERRVVLEAARPIEGRVVDEATGAPVGGAKVETLVDGRKDAETLAGHDGSFALAADARADRLRASATGYVPLEEPVPRGPGPFLVRLRRAASVEGRVRAAEEADFGPPFLVAWKRIAPAAGATTVSGEVTTDAEGAFALTGLEPGRFEIAVRSAPERSGLLAFLRRRRGSAAVLARVQVDLAPGPNDPLEILLSRPSPAALVVRVEGMEQGAPGFRAVVELRGDVQRRAIVPPGGVVRFADLPPMDGTLVVTLEPVSGDVEEPFVVAFQSVRLEAGREVERTVTIEEPRRLDVHLLDAVTGKPIEGRVAVEQGRYSSARDTRSGRVSLLLQGRERATVWCLADGHRIAVRSVEPSTLGPSPLELRLHRHLPAWTARWVDEDGRPLAGAGLTLRGVEGLPYPRLVLDPVSWSTDERGACELRGRVLGTVEIEVREPSGARWNGLAVLSENAAVLEVRRRQGR